MTIDAEKGEGIFSFTERLVKLAKLSGMVQGVEGRFNDIIIVAHADSRPGDLRIIWYFELENIKLKNKYGEE